MIGRHMKKQVDVNYRCTMWKAWRLDFIQTRLPCFTMAALSRAATAKASLIKLGLYTGHYAPVVLVSQVPPTPCSIADDQYSWAWHSLRTIDSYFLF